MQSIHLRAGRSRRQAISTHWTCHMLHHKLQYPACIGDVPREGVDQGPRYSLTILGGSLTEQAAQRDHVIVVFIQHNEAQIYIPGHRTLDPSA